MWKKLFCNNDKKKAEAVDTLDEALPKEALPRHVAIIMDGNGRWAVGKGLLRTAGHRAGVKTLKKIVQACTKMHIEVLTVYAFSTENWKRPLEEVDLLMKLFSEFLEKEIDEMDNDNVKINFIGRINELSLGLQKQMAHAMNRTRSNTGVKFNVAVNYGGRDELVRSVQEIADEVLKGNLSPKEIDENTIDNCLDTKELPPVDLLIRTSGDMRISNFLLWQTAYAEFWFTDVNWPDFSQELFMEALRDFAMRDRRFGGLSRQNG